MNKWGTTFPRLFINKWGKVVSTTFPRLFFFNLSNTRVWLASDPFFIFYLIIYFHKYEVKKGNQRIKLKTADMNPTVR